MDEDTLTRYLNKRRANEMAGEDEMHVWKLISKFNASLTNSCFTDQRRLTMINEEEKGTQVIRQEIPTDVIARKGKDDEVDDPIEFQNIPGSDDYIEFLGEVDDEFGNIPGTADYVEELGEVDDIGAIVHCDNIGRDDEDDSDSHDSSYMEHLESVSECFDSEESLVDDYEIHGDPEDRSSDEDEGNISEPLLEWDSRRGLDGSEKRASFTLGMTFLDRGCKPVERMDIVGGSAVASPCSSYHPSPCASYNPSPISSSFPSPCSSS
ncbi:hypothetical protein K1719_003797 [Acacia pycnantha]|nr:hypothetical protein K1719_003797 [Acacia pycnantha]